MSLWSRFTALFGGAAKPAEVVARRYHPEDDATALRQLAPDAITAVTVAEARTVLEAHEAGLFGDSARLAEHLLRDPDVQQALGQRVLGVTGLPFALEAADPESALAAALAKELGPRWSRAVSAAALADLLRCAVVMGFAVAQVCWCWDEDAGELVPTLEPWHPAYVDHQPHDGSWWATAAEGRFRITPGDGRWFLWTPHSPRRSFQYGAIRCIAGWFLRAEYAARDWGRWTEVHGQGTWLARLPAGSRETPDGKAFLASIRTIGRAAVIPLPQGATPETSYGVELAESNARGWEGFDQLGQAAARKFRMALLCQDLTSAAGPDGGSYAQSKVGNTVRGDVKAADAGSLGEALQHQVVRPWVRSRKGTPALSPKPTWDASPPADLLANATAIKTAGDAAVVWKGLGWDVDLVTLAKQYDVPGKLASKPAPLPARDPPPFPPKGGEPAPADEKQDQDDADAPA